MFNIPAIRKYIFCIYGGLGAASPVTSATVTLHMLSNITTNVVPFATAAKQLTVQSMQRVCLVTPSLPAPGRYYFAVRMGSTAAVYLFDDAYVEYTT